MKPAFVYVLAVLVVVCVAAPASAMRGGRGGRGSTPRAGGARGGPVGTPRLAPTPHAGARAANPPGNAVLHSVLRPGPDAGPPGHRGDELHGRLGLGDRTNLPNAASLPPAAASAWTAGHPAPFTAAWYANHPNVFHVVYPHADAVAAVTAASLAAWLTVPAAVTVASVDDGSTVQVVTEVEALAGTSSVEAAPVPATTGVILDATQWLPIGVFSVKPPSGGQATRVVHLYVDRAGNLRGSQLDLLSEGVDEVQGQINKETQIATWTIGSAQAVSFEASVRAFTESEHDVTVRFATGVTETWQLVRVAQ